MVPKQTMDWKAEYINQFNVTNSGKRMGHLHSLSGLSTRHYVYKKTAIK